MGQRCRDQSGWAKSESVGIHCVCVMGLVCVQGSLCLGGWGGAVGPRGSCARCQQWGDLGCGGAQLLDPVSLQLWGFKKCTLWMGIEEIHLCMNPCFSLEQGSGWNHWWLHLSVSVFVNLCGWTYVFENIHISVALCGWLCMCLLGILAQLY